ncbi:hypothetical protein ECG_04916 [Echinococcus granulosus]|uniref:Uncharacterized protein n=1 Tax=Echinococcus granulosus TaxID=6210 RepID=A0A068WAR9_ECHGR|nr:hypothetical protein ECG_04916 [Echinococcus granulosus]CDS16741.1 hypothetical protein EgrG_000944400 [Echinococcus granulosus]
MSTSSARPTGYTDALNDTIFSRWRRPFFNPYPSWVSYLQQIYSRRHRIDNADQFDKRPFFNVFPSYRGENEHSDNEDT